NLSDIDEKIITQLLEQEQQAQELPATGLSIANHNIIEHQLASILSNINASHRMSMKMKDEPAESYHVRYMSDMNSSRARYVLACKKIANGKKRKTHPSIEIPDLRPLLPTGWLAYVRVSRILTKLLDNKQYHHPYPLTSNDVHVLLGEGSLYDLIDETEMMLRFKK
ncbi:unnamed protein product, partial [Didymodactylos carnosus]